MDGNLTQDFENMEPLSNETFQQLMNQPSTMNDAYFGRLTPVNPQYLLQPAVYTGADNKMATPLTAQGGGMAQADPNLDPALLQQSTGSDMAAPGNAAFGSAPQGALIGAPGGRFASGHGGNSAATSRTVTPGPDTSQNFYPGSA